MEAIIRPTYHPCNTYVFVFLSVLMKNYGRLKEKPGNLSDVVIDLSLIASMLKALSVVRQRVIVGHLAVSRFHWPCHFASAGFCTHALELVVYVCVNCGSKKGRFGDRETAPAFIEDFSVERVSSPCAL